MEPEPPSLDHRLLEPRRIPGFWLVWFVILVLFGLLILGLYNNFFISRTDSNYKQHSTLAALSNLNAALDAFCVDTHRYPTTAEGLAALVTKPVGADGWHPYMDAIPTDKWDHPYIYRCPGTQHPATFDLLSCGPDGIEGTADDVDKDSK